MIQKKIDANIRNSKANVTHLMKYISILNISLQLLSKDPMIIKPESSINKKNYQEEGSKIKQKQILNISLASPQTAKAYYDRWVSVVKYNTYLRSLSYDQMQVLRSQLKKIRKMKCLNQYGTAWLNYKIHHLTNQIEKKQKALKNVEPRVKQTNGSVNKEYRVTQSSKIKPSHPKQHKESLQAQTVESGIWKFFKCFNFGASKETYDQSESQEGTPLNENKID